MNEQTKRLFLALWPGESEQERFSVIAHQYQPTDKCRLMAAQRLHLTLIFFGSLNAATERCVREVCGSIAWQPMEIVFDRLGWFAQPRVMWIGCSQPQTQLLSLVGHLSSRLVRCGIEPEQRRYQPHITVARNVTRSPKTEKIEPVSCSFDSMALVESRSNQHGVEYRTLSSWPAPAS